MKLIEHIQVIQLLVYPFKRIGPYLFGADAFQNTFGLAWVVPEIGLVGYGLFVFYFNNLTIVVKDTSSKPTHGLLNP
jgi:hypothetical protein